MQDKLPTRSELDQVHAKVATTMVKIVDRTVTALDKLNERLDKLDDAIAAKADLNTMNFAQLTAYFFQMKESFKLRQEFLRAMSGYNVDTDKVPVEDKSNQAAQVISEADADKIKAELLKRSSSQTPKQE